MFGTLNLATSFSFVHSFVAFSSDKNYKFEVISPRFTNDVSYSFFQTENFLHLTASEGAEVAKSAAVTGYLYQKRKDDYVLIWCRPLASTVIPRRAFVLGTGTDILIVVDGQRSEVPVSSNYFGFYNFDGVSLTNGLYQASKRDTWSLNGKVVQLSDEQNRPQMTIDLRSIGSKFPR